MALLVASASLLAGCATMGETPSQKVDGASVSYSLAGTGAPAVVFEAGLGDSKSSWSTVFSEVGKNTTAFAYDRPGYSPRPGLNSRYRSDRDGRTGKEVATHLRELLDQAGVEPPFVLVGHSIGGLYVLSFAKLYPEDVAGIVLVDGRPPDFTAACKAESASMCELPRLMVAVMPPHQRAEVKGMPETERDAPDPEELAGVPITVIAATEPDIVSSRAFQDLLMARQKAFAQGANGRYVEATGSTHYVHQKQPELVVGEIQKMLDGIRSTRTGNAAAEL
ncbi:MAG: alpha/beta hydrolase [Acidobacteriota bacterium]|nr:alpha/beta hydrolase [Acidobacteriota bacterium]